MLLDNDYDVLIVGCGAAGLGLALQLPDNLSIKIIAKCDFRQNNTYQAQGGISAAISAQDSPEKHCSDTLNAGQNLCDAKVVAEITAQAPSVIDWLEKIGMAFTSDDGHANQSRKLHLNQEAGHSLRRVVHSDDSTGKTLQNTLLTKVMQQANIKLVQNCIAIDLFCANGACHGAYVLDYSNNQVMPIAARTVALATGGTGKVYLYTSNSDEATGDGVAMAWRAGCRIANMEFIQFHPSCLYHPEAKSFLLSEALRGEGAKLLLPNGEPFMHKFDQRGELAPRDIVARAIDHEMKRLGTDHVLLDISHRDKNFLMEHFPMIYRKCLHWGYDITQVPIPIVPAMHYCCGGVISSLHGETDIDNLYAIGEVAHTGLHGANRMASNSLLECLAFARRAAQSITKKLSMPSKQMPIPDWDEEHVVQAPEEIMVAHNWHELRQTMSNYVGIVRTQKRLRAALSRIQLLSAEIDEHYRSFYVSKDLLELRNIALVAKLIILSAISRRESRGLHTIEDYPEIDPKQDYKMTCLTPPSFQVKQINYPKS